MHGSRVYNAFGLVNGYRVNRHLSIGCVPAAVYITTTFFKLFQIAAEAWTRSQNVVLPRSQYASTTLLLRPHYTPFTQLLPTRVCFTNAGVNTYGAEIHKVRKHAIYAFPSFLFLILLFRLYVKEPFSKM